MYNNDAFTMRFVISNPGEIWSDLIQHENDTYHDIIILPHLQETSHVANTIKTIEFYRHLANSTSTSKWDYVSKVDDDSFVDTETFYHEYLEPRPSATNTMVARPMNDIHRPYAYPQGQFYTLSWDMVLEAVDIYTKAPITDEHEDALIGRLFYEAGRDYELVELTNERFHDYGPENKIWTYLDTHAITNRTISAHLMKDDEMYIEVASQMAALRNETDCATTSSAR
jgi:beta-1,3-galactosyltransferase 1